MKKINSEFIEESADFRKVAELKYDEIIGFVFRNIRLKTPASQLYFIINILNLLLVFYFLILGMRADSVSLGEFIRQLVSGLFAGSILVIPFHEGFHGLAFKLAGAPKVHFGADFRQMIFYVTAHKYVINRKTFYFVALAPFVMINLLAVAAFIVTGWPALFTLLFFLFFHNIMCIGDFAMISYYQDNAEKDLYTFDDIFSKTSYIYEKIHKEEL